MSNYTTAAPKLVFGGMEDISTRTVVPEPLPSPQHKPLLRLWTPSGPDTIAVPVDLAPGAFQQMFGADALNRRSAYWNNQSLLAETLLSAGNGFEVERLKPADAKPPARLIMGIDIGVASVPSPDDPEVMIDGIKFKLVLLPNTENKEVGALLPVAGSIVGPDDEQSKIYPLFELPTAFFGKMGNLKGIRLWCPTDLDTLGYDTVVTDQFKTRMYRMQFMRKLTPTGSPVITNTVFGSNYTDFSFDRGVWNEANEIEYYAGETVTVQYADDGFANNTAPTYSPFSQFYVYDANVKIVRDLIHATVSAAVPGFAATLDGAGQIDFLTAMGFDGQPYPAVVQIGAIAGGVVLGNESVVYASGGEDGTMNADTYEEAVLANVAAFVEQGEDMYPVNLHGFSHVYDTGLSLEGKYAFMAQLGARQDLQVHFTTLSEKDTKPLTRNEEVSRGQAIFNRLRAFPESTVYNTPVTRAMIVHQSGQVIDSNTYRKQVPQLIDVALRRANQFGAGTGLMREGKDMDVSPNNRQTLLRNMNVKFFNDKVQNAIWLSGGTISQVYDHRSQYYPCFKSVNKEDTSVLMSPVTVDIACDAIRQVRKIHRDFSGNSKWTKEQFIDRSDKALAKMFAGRYGEGEGRVRVVPRTYFTKNDDLQGFSWHCRLTLYANTVRNVMEFEFLTERMENFNG